MYQLNLYTRHHSATVYSLFYQLNQLAATLYISTHHQHKTVMDFHWRNIGLIVDKIN